MKSDHVLRLKDGQSINYRHIFDAYYKTLTSFACKYTSNWEESESIVQDTFFTLWEKRNSFSDELAVKAFLYATTRNKSLNYLRHCKVHEKYSNQVSSDWGNDVYYTQSMIEEETFHLVFRALNTLPEKQRTVCLLVMEGKDNSEIAEILGISVSMVKFHKRNAYGTLREKLSDDYFILFLSVFYDPKIVN